MRWRAVFIGASASIMLVACVQYTQDGTPGAEADAAPAPQGPSASGGVEPPTDGSAVGVGSSGAPSSGDGGGSGSGSGPGGPDGSTLSLFQSTVLDGMNAARAAAPSASPALPSLVWNAADAAAAKVFTDTCSSDGPPGSVVYGGGTQQDPAADVIARINVSGGSYTYSTNTCTSGDQCALYKLVVQRTLNSVGCDVSYCGGSGYRWACIGRTFTDYSGRPY